MIAPLWWMWDGGVAVHVALVGRRYEIDGPALRYELKGNALRHGLHGPQLLPNPLIGPDTEEDDLSQPFPRHDLQ